MAAKKKSTESNPLDRIDPNEPTELAPVSASDVAALFGEPDLPLGVSLPVISINKDSCTFTSGDEEGLDAVTGHLIHQQAFNLFYEGKYDPKNPQPPLCSSSNGIRPDGGAERQAETCDGCRQKEFSEELGCPPCQNRLWIYFLRDGAAVPSIINAAPTNFSKKGGPKRIQEMIPHMMNAAAAAGVGPRYPLCHIELTLKEVMFNHGGAAVLQASILDVENKNIERIKELARLKEEAKRDCTKHLTEVVEAGIAGGDEQNRPEAPASDGEADQDFS